MPAVDRHRPAGPSRSCWSAARCASRSSLRPFSLTVRRAGRRLLRAGGVWVADGTIHDHFIQFTEGVVPREAAAPRGSARCEPRCRVAITSGVRARRSACTAADEATAVRAASRARGRVSALELSRRRRAAAAGVRLGPPLRGAVRRPRRAPRHPVRPGRPRRAARRRPALHRPRLPAGDARGRAGSRRATAPRCRGCCSSRGYGVLVQTDANGTRFDLAGRADLGLDPRRSRPAAARAPVRPPRPPRGCAHFCRLTGFPALLPEWGYGFWKSRDVHEHQDDVLDDFDGFRAHGIPLDAIVIDSPWATQYNTWEFNPHQFPDAPGMIAAMRADGVRTVVWCTPWVNLDSRDGQIPPQPGSERLHREPAPNYAPGAARRPLRARIRRRAVRDPVVDGHRLAGRLHQPGGRGVVAGTGQARPGARRRGDQGRRRRGLLHPRRRAARRRPVGREAGVGARRPSSASVCSARSTRSIPVAASCSGAAAGPASTRPDSPGPAIRRRTSGRCACSSSRRSRAACSGFSNWSHDVGGYLGHRLVERCPPELLVRWLQFGCFTPLMHAHGRMPQEPWHYGERVLDLYRAYVLLHEQLVPYVRAAAATARAHRAADHPAAVPDRPGRPARLDDRRRLRLRAVRCGSRRCSTTARASARSRCRAASGSRPGRARACAAAARWSCAAPLDRDPGLGARRARSSSPTRPPTWQRGLGDVAGVRAAARGDAVGHAAPAARASARLADGTRITWRRGTWSVTGSPSEREVRFRTAAG